MTEKMTAVQGKKPMKDQVAAAPAPHHAPAGASAHEHKPVSSEAKPADAPKEKQEKKTPPKITKKEEAVAHGISLAASKKHCMYICEFIKGKSIDVAIKDLQDVIAFKRPVPMRGEIPHRSYPGVMSGRYPIKVAKQFITILKGLRGNVIVNGMDLQKTRIYFGMANWASRPQRKGGMAFKRTHVVLKAKEFDVKEAKK